MYQQNSITFLRDLSELLLKYNVTLEQLKSGRIIVGDDEVMLDRLKFNEQQFVGTIVANVSGFFSERQPDPKPVYLYAGETKAKHRCVYCQSSLYRNFWGLRTHKCINPECFNFHKPQGFPVAQVAEGVNAQS